MAESRGRKKSIEKDRKAVEELVMDYACKNCMDDVITAVVEHRGHATFTELCVPHLRVIVGTIHSIVQRMDIMNFDLVILLLGAANMAAPDLLSVKQYVKLSTGLKTKVLLNKLSQGRFDYADVCSHLNQYFPKAELKTSGVSQQDAKLNAYQLRYRRLVTRLMLSVSEREAYLRHDMDAELGPAFTAGIQRLSRLLMDRVNKRLSRPVIEQIVAEGPHSQISHDIQDSQSDCMDQLLSASFQGPPSPETLLSILKASWEEETGETTEEEGMELSDGMDDDDNVMSATDIFDFPTPPLNTRTPSSPSKQPQPPRPALAPKSVDEASHADPSHGCPDDTPVHHKPGSSKTQGAASHPNNEAGVDCAGQPSSQLDRVESPEQRNPAVGTFQKEECRSLISSSSAPVSKSRIYLSKSGQQNGLLHKRTRYTAVQNGSCIGLTRVESYSDSKIGSLIKTYQACVESNICNNDGSVEVADTQISSSSDSLQSDKSSTSVSLLSGLTGFSLAPKRPRSWSPVMTAMPDDEEMTALTMSHPFEDTIISEIDVYPVTRLQHGGAENGHIRSTNNSGNELEMMQEAPTDGGAVCSTASQPAEQVNTVSSSSYNTLDRGCSSTSGNSQSQTREARVEEEADEVQEIREDQLVPDTEGKGSCSDDVDSKHAEAEGVKGDRSSSMSRPLDIEEGPTPKKAQQQVPLVKLKRLSQERKVKRYLKSSSLSTGSTSMDATSQSSDSEDSFVPDSEDEESTSTSDSSSLPCIELRPDSECETVRRFPTLEQYLHESQEQASTSPSQGMRQCTVRLRRLKANEIDALTKGRMNMKP